MVQQNNKANRWQQRQVHITQQISQFKTNINSSNSSGMKTKIFWYFGKRIRVMTRIVQVATSETVK